MKDKEKIFELLRGAAETPDEERNVEDLIRKVNFEQPTIIKIDERHVKFDGRVYRKNGKTDYWVTSYSLHRDIWRFFFGEIPKDYDIHHSDFNPKNNNLQNLELLTKSEHRKIHAAATVAKPQTFKCVVCGKEFEALKALNRANRCCSEACRKSLAKKKYVCECCGREFYAYKYHEFRFCSRECADKIIRPRNPAKYETKTCPTCGKVFTARISNHRIYCSRSCANRAYEDKGTEIRTCPVCGKDFETVKAIRKNYCSQECANEAQKKKTRQSVGTARFVGRNLKRTNLLIKDTARENAQAKRAENTDGENDYSLTAANVVQYAKILGGNVIELS